MEKCYQPFYYFDDGTNVQHGEMPEELRSFMAFPTREDCERWLDDNGYDPRDYAIMETEQDDIDDLVLVDGDGYFLDGTCSVSAYDTNEELDRVQGLLEQEIAQKLNGKDRLYFTRPALLYENKNDLMEYDPQMSDEERHIRAEIESVNTEYAYDTDGTVYRIWNIVDFDDIENLRYSVSES